MLFERGKQEMMMVGKDDADEGCIVVGLEDDDDEDGGR